MTYLIWFSGVVNNQTYLDEINSDFSKWAPVAFVYEKDTEQSRKVSRGLKKAYFNNKPIDKSQFDNLSKVTNNINFIYDCKCYITKHGLVRKE